MTFANEGDWDRGVRLLGGAVLAGLGWGGVLPAPLGLVATGVGAVVLATGIVGWCPAYTVFGLSTHGAATGHCSHCDAGQRV